MERGIMGKVEMVIIKVKDVKEVNGFGDHVAYAVADDAAWYATNAAAYAATHVDAAVARHVPLAAITNDDAAHDAAALSDGNSSSTSGKDSSFRNGRMA